MRFIEGGDLCAERAGYCLHISVFPARNLYSIVIAFLIYIFDILPVLISIT